MVILFQKISADFPMLNPRNLAIQDYKNENEAEKRFTSKNLYNLQSTIFLAKEMGKGMG